MDLREPVRQQINCRQIYNVSNIDKIRSVVRGDCNETKLINWLSKALCLLSVMQNGHAIKFSINSIRKLNFGKVARG
jgi:hypothetical protein